MFEELRMGQAPISRIVLQTHRGVEIPNSIALPVGEREIRVYQLFREQHGARWEPRKPACGVYNCFGHVFACRRTSIYDESNTDVEKILEQDGYRILQPNELPMPDDVALYRNVRSGVLLHAGRVSKVTPSLVPILDPITGISRNHEIHVLSKWNDALGEDLHLVSDVPYQKQGFEITTELWTDRKLM